MSEKKLTDFKHSDIEESHVKRQLNPMATWLIMAILVLLSCFLLILNRIIPLSWAFIISGFVMLICLGMYIFTKKNLHTDKKKLVKIINIVLSFFFLVMAILPPYVQGRISQLIDSSREADNKIRINVYVMSDEYKKAHPEVFGNTTTTPSYASSEEELKTYTDKMFISAVSTDAKKLRVAIDQVKSVLDVSMLNMTDANSLQEAAVMLYENKGDALFMSSMDASILKGMDEYEFFDKETRILYSIDIETVNPVIHASNELTKQPFAIFFGGNDEEGELKLFGKTDVDLVVVVNPTSYQILMVSFPRDSYVPNYASGGYADKLTHLGIGGIDNTLQTLSELLGIDINNYLLLNFTTYQKIIDALDGVTVNNPYAFSFWDNPAIHFEEGNIHLDGYNALLYVRERKTLPDGDFGRTMHQQLVMRAIIEKLISPAIITRFDSLMTSMQNTFLTNLSEDAIYGLCQYQLSKGPKWNIVNYRIEGDVGNAYCAYAPGMPLSVVYPSSDQISFVAEEIRKVVNGEAVSQQELPLPYGRLNIAEIASAPTEETYIPEATPSYIQCPDGSYAVDYSACPAVVVEPTPAVTEVSPTEPIVEEPVVQEPVVEEPVVTPAIEEVAPTPIVEETPVEVPQENTEPIPAETGENG
ncbi:MAG: LCP family protein [Solobacterium sp.]|nr:LCP family protein [Solobacterium sp.]